MATTTPNTHAQTHTRIHRPPPAAHTIGTDQYFFGTLQNTVPNRSQPFIFAVQEI